jgi:hypothetical protein
MTKRNSFRITVSVEEHIAEHLNYRATVSFVDGTYMCVAETQLEIVDKLFAN